MFFVFAFLSSGALFDWAISQNIETVLAATRPDIQRLLWLESFALTGIEYGSPRVETLGPGAGEPILVLTAPTSIAADHVRINGTIQTRGMPLTIQARLVEFLPGSQILGFNSQDLPPEQAAVPEPAGPGRSGYNASLPRTMPGGMGLTGMSGAAGLSGIDGAQSPGAISIYSMYIIGRLRIQARGQNGGIGGRGGPGGRGGDGGQGSAAQCRVIVSGERAGPGGPGGWGGVGGVGGTGGRPGSAVPIDIRMGGSEVPTSELLSEVVSAPGSPGAGGQGGFGGPGGAGGPGGNGDVGHVLGVALNHCGRGPDGVGGNQGAQGPTGPAGPQHTSQSSLTVHDLRSVFAAYNNAILSTLWLHLWRNLWFQTEDLRRVIVGLELRLARDPSLAGSHALNGIAENILYGPARAINSTIQDLGAFPIFGAQTTASPLDRFLDEIRSRRSNILTSQMGEIDQLLAVLVDLSSIKRDFLALGLNPVWRLTVNAISQRLNQLQPVIFGRFRNSCVALATQQTARVDALLGMMQDFTLPICQAVDFEATAFSDFSVRFPHGGRQSR